MKQIKTIIMKTKRLLIIFLSFLFIYGCSSSSDSNNNTTSVTDADGNVYQTVTICNQVWTKSNLNVSHYRNGDVIPQVIDPVQWANLTTGAWCYYANTSSNGTIYGKLYNWYAVNDPRGLAPVGCHIPNDLDWTALTTCLEGSAIAGGKMKETGTVHWETPNVDATNSSGFTGLGGGIRSYSNTAPNLDEAAFYEIGLQADFWSSTESSATLASAINLLYDTGGVNRFEYYKIAGFSVRCIKD
jgi:uncharacterized protein (TIGR02145 family)